MAPSGRKRGEIIEKKIGNGGDVYWLDLWSYLKRYQHIGADIESRDETAIESVER
jgi:hypothetical protein